MQYTCIITEKQWLFTRVYRGLSLVRGHFPNVIKSICVLNLKKKIKSLEIYYQLKTLGDFNFIFQKSNRRFIKRQNAKQRSAKHTHKTKVRVTRTPLKTGVNSGAPQG
jgi:hypothetical protein